MMAVVLAPACGHPPPATPPPPPPPPPADSEQVPAQLVDFMQSHGWGQLHTAWHTARRWDLLPPASLAFAQSQGWARAQRQEGEPGNGLEFLAMHRMMFEMLRTQPGAVPELFAGWPTPPTDPHAGLDFDPNMRAAIDRLAHHIGDFASEDELGLYIETAMRPTPGNPAARAQDATAGVHNYLHNRFQDRTSPVDLGNPAVNLMNRQFWQLHGWVDHLWASYRALHGLRDDDPAYQEAMAEAMRAMSIHTKGIAVPPPAELVDALSAI